MPTTQTPFEEQAHLFARELKLLCWKYNVSNVVTLVEFSKQFTGIIQWADTKQCEPNPTYTDIKRQLQEQLEAILIKLQKGN